MTSLTELYKLRTLHRWQNVPTVRSESVAEHTAMCCLIVLRLEAMTGISMAPALRYAAVHDLSEIWTTDVPHNVKKRFAQIAASVELAEQQLWTKELRWAHRYKANATPVQLAYAKLADTLSVVQFARSELMLGNSHFTSILSEATEIALRIAHSLNDRTIETAVAKLLESDDV